MAEKVLVGWHWRLVRRWSCNLDIDHPSSRFTPRPDSVRFYSNTTGGQAARATLAVISPYHFPMLLLARGWNFIPEPYRTIVVVGLLLVIVGGVIWQNRTPRPANRRPK